MAATYRCYGRSAFGSSRAMLSLWNGSGSGKVLRVYRVWILNHQFSSVSGTYTSKPSLHRITAHSGGSALSTVKMDTNSANLPAQVVCTEGATVTTSGVAFMTFLWNCDETAPGVGAMDDIEAFQDYGLIFDATRDADLEPIVIRQSEGLALINSAATAVGVAQIIFEFTVE